MIDSILVKKSYANYVFTAKSIGTIALSQLLANRHYKDAKAIWLTPLLQRSDVYDGLLNCRHQGMCFIGDEDPCYIEEKLHPLKLNQKLTLHLIPGANHSLDQHHHAVDSIDILKDVIGKIDDFL
nr:hypothetical protein [Evansella caseinilytica]